MSHSISKSGIRQEHAHWSLARSQRVVICPSSTEDTDEIAPLLAFWDLHQLGYRRRADPFQTPTPFRGYIHEPNECAGGAATCMGGFRKMQMRPRQRILLPMTLTCRNIPITAPT